MKLFRLRKSSLKDLFVIILVFLLVIENYSDKLYSTLMPIELLMGSMILGYSLLKIRNINKIVYLWGAVFFFGILSSFLVGNLQIPFLIKILLVFFPISLYMLVSQNSNPKLWVLLAISILIYILIQWIRSVDGYLLFSSMSRNYISVYGFISLFFLAYAYNLKHKEFPIMIPIIYFSITVIAVGRGGIISGFVMFILFLRLKIKENNNRANIYRNIVLFLVLIFLFIYVLINYEIIVATYFPRFSVSEAIDAQNSTSQRLNIIYSYLSSLSNIKNLLFGTNIQELSILFIRKTENLHNSYLMMHALFGVVGFTYIIKQLVISTRILINQKNYSMAITVISFLIRSLFDYCFAGFMGDIIIFYLIMMPYLCNQQLKRKKRGQKEN